MDIEQIINIFTIVVNLAGLMLCLFRYFKRAHKTILFGMIFFLGNLLSNYYWGVYQLVMKEDPDVSSFLANLGWNIAFVMLAHMQFAFRREQGIKKLSPFSLIPVPFSIAQLVLYLQFGAIFNNIWQVFWMNAIVCLSLDSLIHFHKNKKQGMRFPYASAAIFLFAVNEFLTWTATCFDWPNVWLDPYYYLSVVSGICYVLIPLATKKVYESEIDRSLENRLTKAFKVFYIAFLVCACDGGVWLAVWMKDTLAKGIGEAGESNPFTVIAVMLFVVSVVIVSFTASVILVVGFDQKTRERERLEKEKRLAEESNAAKSEFLADMSHEIRTPINAVLGMNEMIMRESLNARDHLPDDKSELEGIFADLCNYSGNIDSAGKNLLSIINDILDFSKIEAGKLEIVNHDYQLSSVLNDVSNMIAYKAENKGLDFEVDVDSRLSDGLFGDEVRIRQIMVNLLNNAVKYTHSGKIELAVSQEACEETAEENVTLLTIRVKDTGIGIKEEDRERLFGKFERMDVEKNRSIEGTGLGLAITGSLVEMMHGSIDVDSIYGKGTTFSVSIPQKVVSDEPIGDFREKFENAIRSLEAEKESFHAGEARILVVDDTLMNLVVVKGLLKNTQIHIDTALSGGEAIEIAKANPYDLIMMDQRMPEIDGTMAMQKIKEDPDGPNAKTPVICLTADAVTGAKERYLAEGFDGYLTKPVNSDDLEAILLEFIPKDKIHSTSEETAKPASAGRKLLDRQYGLSSCGGDEDAYGKLLLAYVQDSDKMVAALDSLYESKDYKMYAERIRTLRRTSKTIGAEGFSELLDDLYTSVVHADTKAIREKHERVQTMYHAVINAVNWALRRKN